MRIVIWPACPPCSECWKPAVYKGRCGFHFGAAALALLLLEAPSASESSAYDELRERLNIYATKLQPLAPRVASDIQSILAASPPEETDTDK